jgi:Domain of unknown function (DUF1704)
MDGIEYKPAVEIDVPKTLWESFTLPEVRARNLALLKLTQRLIGACTPLNLFTEQTRLTRLAQVGRFEAPGFEYAALPSVSIDCENAHPLWKARARELQRENRIVQVLGTPELAPAVHARWSDSACSAESDTLAEQWLREDVTPEALHCTSTGREPDSLISRLRFALRDTSVEVHPRSGMSALAATGMDCVYVCENRKISTNDVLRTVLHEVEGHVKPRLRARASDLSILILGTALGAETQEGYALLCEERAGLLTGKRRHTLALRHLAVSRMQSGASFPEVAQWLCDHTDVESAVALSCRIFRGTANGMYPGLGREALYLPYYLRLRNAEEEYAITRCGQVGLGAAPELKAACKPALWSRLLELAETYS